MTTAKTSPRRPDSPLTTVAMVTLGCARNEVDSEELAGRLEAGGFRLVDDPEDADTVMVNTCGFVEAAKKDSVVVPGHTIAAPDLEPTATPASGPRAVRRRLDGGPMAPLKLASGCDRRCSFCAIPSFRGSFVSRRPSDVLGEARWLAEEGVRELFLVSENSTSYGKDLGDLRLLETLLPELAAVDGVERVRVSYLQPAETRPGLVTALASTPGVAAYYDLSFQHASNAVLRRMRRFGDPESFLGLLDQARAQAPQAGARSNFIVGFPGETEADLATLCDFLVE